MIFSVSKVAPKHCPSGNWIFLIFIQYLSLGISLFFDVLYG